MATTSLPLWKRLTFALVTVVLLLGLLELALMLAGVDPRLHADEDPFVGFASNVPLFVQTKSPSGESIYQTAGNKSGYFNVQTFAVDKPAGVHRVFCVGGSTTYGRPYDDRTSFAGWLRAYLPLADAQNDWEVINAGGISYASYRVAKLVEELVEYDADLLIVYTGHNEFLEERTYGGMRDRLRSLQAASTLAARTRIGSALANLVKPGDRIASTNDERATLPREVQARLDHSAGLELYERDDVLRDDVLAHYRFSLQRIAQLARQAKVDVLFVTPASNLADFSPFKSQSTHGLTPASGLLVADRLTAAKIALEGDRFEEALALLDEALAVDGRHAELHYRRGKALEALGRFDEAAVAYGRARDEDVCPLRALSQMPQIVDEVALETGSLIVDYVDRLGRRSRERTGSVAPGEEFFLDHVHPTIEAHRILAETIVATLAGAGRLPLSDNWTPQGRELIRRGIEDSIDPASHALALGNLALTLSWAGKSEDSQRLAQQALEMGVEDATVLLMAARHAVLEGRIDDARAYYSRALDTEPGSPVLHSQVGFFYAGHGEIEAATAHFFLASLQWQDNESFHQQLGGVLSQRGRDDVALASYQKALELAPQSTSISATVQRLRTAVGEGALGAGDLYVTRFDSGFPKVIAQTFPGPDGQAAMHGLWTEWRDGGSLARLVDYRWGEPNGVDVSWDEQGREVERTRH